MSWETVLIAVLISMNLSALALWVYNRTIRRDVAALVGEKD